MKTYAVIRGDRAFTAYCLKRWGTTASFSGVFGHVGDADVETIWAKAPSDDGYTQYFILSMTHPKGQFTDQQEIRKKVYEDIRNGRLTLLQG